MEKTNSNLLFKSLWLEIELLRNRSRLLLGKLIRQCCSIPRTSSKMFLWIVGKKTIVVATLIRVYSVLSVKDVLGIVGKKTIVVATLIRVYSVLSEISSPNSYARVELSCQTKVFYISKHQIKKYIVIVYKYIA